MTVYSHLRLEAYENCPFKYRIRHIDRVRRDSAGIALDGDELDPGNIRRQDEGIEPEIVFFDDPAEQQQLLVAALERLYNEGYSGREIAILSPRRDDACAAKTIDEQPWNDRIKSLRALSHDPSSGNGYIGYCTIQAFKGLEAPAVVITDIGEVDKPETRALLYIGAEHRGRSNLKR